MATLKEEANPKKYVDLLILRLWKRHFAMMPFVRHIVTNSKFIKNNAKPFKRNVEAGLEIVLFSLTVGVLGV